jgi:GntR family phosphonate transport system transcriptional regulator
MAERSREFFMTDTERKTLWHSIATTLLNEIGQGIYPRGGKLPTESDLSCRFGVNRHTVRAALAHMAQTGAVHARRGSGVFVAQDMAEYRLGRRVRFNQNIAALGRLPSRKITRAETLPASLGEAAACNLERGAMVHVVEGLSLADSQPIAMFRSVFPARLTGFLAAVEQTGSITQSLAACGVADYARRETRITAQIANGLQCAALQISQGAALLRTSAVNVDGDGLVVEYGTTWFVADRVALVLSQDDVA